MKKILFILILILVLVGCSNKQKNDVSEDVYTEEDALDGCPEKCDGSTTCRVYKCDSSTGYKCELEEEKDDCCDFNSDCPEDSPKCVNNKCQKECLKSSDCKDGKVCSSKGKCLDCVSDSNCEAKGFKKCVKNECVECVSASDCDYMRPTCHENRCIQCITEEDCTRGRICYYGACRLEEEIREQ
jgi:hypothetical protein